MQDANLPPENQAAEVPSASPHCCLTEEEWADSIPLTHDQTGHAAAQEEEISPNGHGEIESKLARLDELEREMALWEIRRHGYEREVEELKAKLGPETDIRCQRRLFQQALRTSQKSETPYMPEKEKRSRANSATTDLIELVRLVVRDGLRVERLDLIYRSEIH